MRKIVLTVILALVAVIAYASAGGACQGGSNFPCP